MELISINVGVPRTVGVPNAPDPLQREWTSAIFKEPVVGPAWLSRLNLAGDRQADQRNHGGHDKAVNAYAVEHYPYWQAQLGIAHMPYGAFGENFTTRGLLEDSVCIGDVYQVGPAVVQISQPRQPCWKLARRWQVKDLAVQVQDTGRTGWYFRVLHEGDVEAGVTIELVERPHPEWSVSEANAIMHHRKDDREAARVLASCPLLSLSWRDALSQRAATGNSSQ